MLWQDLLLTLREDVRAWAQGRNAFIRIPLWIYLAYAGFNSIKDPIYNSWFGGLIFGTHELGHLLFRAFGEFMSIAGGSIFQIFAPVIGIGMLLYQRDYFGISVVGCWLSFSFYHMATYMADAQIMQLPLFNIGGGDTYHDWEYLLVKFDVLEQCLKLAAITRGIGFAILATSLALGLWVCMLMLQQERRR